MFAGRVGCGGDIFLKENLDVVVCDGFVGNVGLKTSEGVAKFIQNGLKSAFQHNLYSKIMAVSDKACSRGL